MPRLCAACVWELSNLLTVIFDDTRFGSADLLQSGVATAHGGDKLQPFLLIKEPFRRCA